MTWQDISTAPEDGNTVLIWDPVLGCIFGHFSEAEDADDEEGDFWVFQDFVGDDVYGVEPTHWMPLPGKPEQ